VFIPIIKKYKKIKKKEKRSNNMPFISLKKFLGCLDFKKSSWAYSSCPKKKRGKIIYEIKIYFFKKNKTGN
jgi:hypothetical protein